MKRIARKILTAGVAALSILGLGLSTAAPAAAGTSIGTTYNAKTGVYYKFYASTNDFCIKQKQGSKYAAAARFYNESGENVWTVIGYHDSNWACFDVVADAPKIKEGYHMKFGLYLYKFSNNAVVKGPSFGNINF